MKSADSRSSHLRDQIDVGCPFPYAIHPRAGELTAHLQDWYQRMDLLHSSKEKQLTHREQWALVWSLMLPNISFEVLKTTAITMTWVTLYDEAGFEVPALSGELHRVANNLTQIQKILNDPGREYNNQNPYFVAWHDCVLSCRRIFSPMMFERFQRGALRQFYGAACEAYFKAADTIPSLENYLDIRRCTASLGFWLSLYIQTGRGYELPSEVWSSPQFSRLLTTVDELAGLYNDIYGYWRESHQSVRFIPNVITVLSNEYQLSEEIAIQRASAMYRDCLGEYQQFRTAA